MTTLNNEPRRILVAGCGYVGTALARELVQAGHSVVGLRRTPAGLPAGVEPFAADLMDAASLEASPGPFDAVAYTAAADGSSEDAYRRAYVEGLRNLIEAFRRTSQLPRRMVFTSSTGVYAQNGGEWVDEKSPAEAKGYTGAVMREAEDLLWSSGVQGVSLRLGGIYGPGRTRMLEMVARGETVVAEGEVRYVNHQHRDDCAGALAHILSLDNPAPLYLGVDCDPAERGPMLDWIADQLGVPHPRRVPSEQAPGQRGGNKRCSNARLLASGYTFRYPTYREGYGALMDEVRARAGR